MSAKYISKITEVFLANKNPENAVMMKRYMKDNFEFLGIKTPLRRELTKPYLSKSGIPPIEKIEEIARKFWKKPEREFQYFAMDLMGKRPQKFGPEILPFYEYLVLNKSWWDSIDFIAANLIGPLFKNYEDLIGETLPRWYQSGNIWLQRSIILFQLKYKKETDTSILFEYSLKLADSNEFFIQKAIGWALREYSKTDPGAVKKFVSKNKLSNLSEREATRHIT